MSTELARWQFATTSIYHFLFVPVTIGLAFLVALLQSTWHRTENPEYRRQRPQGLPKPQRGLHNRDKDQCPEHHEYTPDNTYQGKRGDGTTFRRCKTCHNAKAKARRDARKADGVPRPRPVLEGAVLCLPG